MPTRKSIKYRCSDSTCKGKRGYVMEATCVNCGSRSLIELTKGHERPGYASGPECPACGVRNWAAWALSSDRIEEDTNG